MKTHLSVIVLLFVVAAQTTAEERIISAGGSITEIMYELGLGHQIIAVDSSSYFPHEATEKPQVGYFRRLSAEGVLSMNPTQLVASNGAGPDEALLHISNAGVAVKVFNQEIYTLTAWKDYVKQVGQYFEVPAKASTIVERVERSLSSIKAVPVEHRKSAVFLMDIGDRGPVAAGNNTVPDMLFELAQLNNIVDVYEGFKPFSSEQLIQLKPDVIVMPSHVVQKMGGVTSICQNMVIKLTTADQGCDVLVLDALLALGFGTRIDEAVEVLLAHES